MANGHCPDVPSSRRSVSKKSVATEISDGETIVSPPIDSKKKMTNQQRCEHNIAILLTGTVSKAQTLSRPLAEY